MAVTLAKFRNAYDEFRGTDDGTVLAKIRLAQFEVNDGVWGDRADAGVMLMTAHMIMMAPAGQNAKLVPKDGKTLYLKMFDRTKRAVVAGFARTAGQPRANAFTDIINNERTFTR